MLTFLCISLFLLPNGESPLFKTDDTAQLDLIGISTESISMKDGLIRLTGKPNGYFATKSKYKNYRLKFDWRYERPENLKSDASFDGNSGLLIHIEGPDKLWPRCIEVQLMNADAGNILALGGKFQGAKDASAQKKAIKPVGEWNAEVVDCKDGAIRVLINEIEVAKGTGAVPSEGRIGWQSEGRPIEFRNITIELLD